MFVALRMTGGRRVVGTVCYAHMADRIDLLSGQGLSDDEKSYPGPNIATLRGAILPLNG